jgi:O-antigen ligase
MKGFAYLAFSFALWVLLDSPSRIKRVVMTIVLSALIQALYAIFLMFGGLEQTPVMGMPIGHRANGSFVYQNHLANYLLLAAAIGVGALVGQFKNSYATSWRARLVDWLQFVMGWKMLFRLALIMIVAGLVLTKSRMGNSAFFASLLITSFIALLFYRDRPKVFSWFVASIIAIDVIIVGSWVGLEKVKQRLEETVVTEEGRLDVIEYAIPAILDKPVLGHGGGSFYSAFNQYLGRFPGGFYDHAHNDYIQFAFEYGIPTLLALGTLIAWVFWINIKTMRDRKSPLMKGTAFGCTMAIIGMMIHCAVDFHFQAPANTLLFVTILTLSLISHTMPRNGYRSIRAK